MKRDLSSLAGHFFDMLVIGGGIFGAGIARDAALRGLSVALVDKGDFASGTSSRSSKLIHGGFRYLEQRDFGLVRESCRERDILRRIAPHLVKPLSFLLPVYESSKHSMLSLRLGMTLYDILALYHNPAPHRKLSAKEALADEPSLASRGLRGAIRFFDCQEDDARFCIENILHAADCGATCANYCEVTGFDTRDGTIRAAKLVDRVGDAGEFEIFARMFVNAAGPWVQRVAQFGGASDADSVALSPTKGVHLVLPRLTRQHGLFFEGRHDGRMMFVIPWLDDCTLLGTTDTDFPGDPTHIHADPVDIAYLLREINELMPHHLIARKDILTTFSGVRPLLRSTQANPSERPREHRIARHGQNLISVAGGKYTTYRAVADQVVTQTYRMLGSRAPRCLTAETPLTDHRPPYNGVKLADSPAIFESDITHACREEMAMTVADVMRRRTPLALSRHAGPDAATAVARIMATTLDWDNAQTSRSLRDYVADWEQSRLAHREALTPTDMQQ